MKCEKGGSIFSTVLALLFLCARSLTIAQAPLPSDVSPSKWLSSLEQSIEELPISPARMRTLEPQVKAFCGDCHAVPNPKCLERAKWYEKVRVGYDFYASSGRNDLAPPPIEDTVKYFRKLADRRIEFPTLGEVDQDWAGRFTIAKVDWKDSEYILPAVSSIAWIKWQGQNQMRLLVTDCRDGSLNLLAPNPTSTKRTLLFRSQNPARMNRCDINADGHDDFVVAELGSILPYDHELGKIACLLKNPKSGTFEPILLAQKLGRVTDVAVGNLLGSSNPDMVVADFGHQHTGGLFLFENVSESQNEPRFKSIRLDSRPGALRSFLHDWNRDGKLDITVLTSQESECIDIYLNRDGRFERKEIWNAKDLTYGSISLEFFDLDADGDLDMLLANGDSFDNNIAMTSGGIQWLENKGDLSFEFHRLQSLPGAYAAKAGDLDGDQDLDIVAVANLTDSIEPLSLREMRSPSILVLEQVRPKEFKTRIVSRDPPRYSTLEIGDFNADGKQDFCVGAILFSEKDTQPRLTFWWQK